MLEKREDFFPSLDLGTASEPELQKRWRRTSLRRRWHVNLGSHDLEVEWRFRIAPLVHSLEPSQLKSCSREGLFEPQGAQDLAESERGAFRLLQSDQVVVQQFTQDRRRHRSNARRIEPSKQVNLLLKTCL